MEHSTFVWTPGIGAVMATGHLGLTNPLPAENYAILGRALDRVARQWDRPVAAWRYADMLRAIPEADPSRPLLPKHMMPNAAGSLISTARDYARFLAASLLPEAHGLLGRRTRDEMLTPAIRLNAHLWWALGWGIERGDGEPTVWHWGNNDIYRAFALGEPATGRALVVLTNSNNGHKLYGRIVRECTGRELAALLWFST